MTKKRTSVFSFRKYLKQNRLKLILYIFAMTAFYVMLAISTLFIANGIGRISDGEWGEAFKLFAISSAILVSSRAMEYLAENMYAKLVRDVSTSIRNDLTLRIFSISSMCFNQNSAGMFVTRLTSSPNNAIDSLSAIVENIGDIISFVVTVVYIACLNFYIGLILVGSIALLGVFEYFKVKMYSKNNKKQKKEYDNVTSYTNEIVRSEKDIKSLNLEGKLKETSVDIYDKYKNAQFKCYDTDSRLWNIRWVIVYIIGFLVVLFAFDLRAMGYLATAGLLYIFMNTDSLGGIAWNIGNIVKQSASMKIEIQRMAQIFDEANFPVEKYGKKQISFEDFKGKIEFKHVVFGYNDVDIDDHEDDSKKKKKKPVIEKTQIIKDLSFEISPGQTVAFVGRSGSGKSTILSLIPKLYECDEGEVLIDEQNVKELSKETLRENIALVNQFPYIFNATIKENMLMSNKDATEEEIIDALEKASLWEFVSGLKKGINTVVGENGVKLSGGQRQRLAIARALLKKSKVIIFDESTSSLDNFAQEKVRKSIENLQGERTVVIVAHRLSTIRNADVIFFLEDGKILAQGTFNELYENNEKFKAMFIAEELSN